MYKWLRDKRRLLLIPFLLLVFAIVPMFTLGAYWVQSVGLLSADAIMIASDAPAADRMMGNVMRGVYGSRIGICDGTADDVQWAAAVASQPSGGKIRASAGTFYFAASISTVHNLTIEGSGKGATILKWANNTNLSAGIIDSDGNCNRILLRDFSIDGNKTNNTDGYGIRLRGAWYSKLENINIHDCTTYGLRLTTTTGSVYCGECYCEKLYSYENDGIGYSITGAGDTVMLECFTYNNTGVGFHLSASANTLIHCHAYLDGGHGIQIDATADHTALIECHLDDSGKHGAYLLANECRLIGNYFFNASQSSGGTYDGLRVTGTHNTIIGNVAIDLQGGSKTQAYGIRESGSADYNTYVGNCVRSSLTANMLITGANSSGVENDGYIAPGEVRTASGTLTAGAANAIGFAWANPEAQDILIQKVVVRITTAGGTANSVLDTGIADDATGTNRGVEFSDDIDLNATAINDSWVAGDGGTQTKWVLCQDSASATDAFVVGQILVANAGSLVGTYYIEYSGA